MKHIPFDLWKAIGAGELFLRTAFPYELHYGTWFSQGVHRPDDRFVVSFTPDFGGSMYHPDGVYNIPLHLDGYGFRKAAGSAEPDAEKVLLLGGYSMLFSYGLSDQNALHARIAEHASHPVTLYNVAWPGLGPYNNYLIYRRTLAADITPRLLVFFVYGHAEGSFVNPDDWSIQPPSRPKTEIARAFRAFPDLSLEVPRAIEKLGLTDLYYRFYTMKMIVNVFDRIYRGIDYVRASTGRLVVHSNPTTPRVASEKAEVVEFSSFIRRLDAYAKNNGSTLTVVFLPKNVSVDGNEGEYDAFANSLPPEVSSLDLNKRFGKQFNEANLFLAAGHYNSKASDLLGRAIAGHIDSLLSRASMK